MAQQRTRAARAAAKTTRAPRAPRGTRGIAPETLASLEWRLVGPFRGGRCVAVAGDPVQRETFYMGTTGGGVWKTTDGGRFWQNLSDGYFRRASVGSIAVATSDPNVIYAGMGEACIRGNVSHGDGVYRSTDGGKTWQHRGLADTRNIGKVVVSPRDPDLVYVAALGHAHGANAERGLFRSRDGGGSWERILYRSDTAGAIDLAMDPRNPRVLYCSLWEAVRGPWSLTSGGPGSGLFRSTDGGDTWQEISRARGLPKGVLGKIGLTVSAARPDRLWAIVEAEDGAVFRSDDGGDSWARLSEDRNLRQRAWYYHHIFADPTDAETVWVLNVEAWRSTDGGATFQQVTIPHGDNHDLWIDPADPRRMICGNDGGGLVSFNGGESWSDIYNQPTAELYHVIADNQRPYRLYAAQQDNTTISLPSRSAIAGVTHYEEYEIGGGESGYVAVDPRDHNVVYAGSYQGFLTRYDHRSGQARNIMVWPEFSSGWGAKDLKYRFQWTFPIHISSHDPGTLYATGNHVFRTTDEGTTWEAISPDLTRADPKTLGPSGGPITKDNTGAEYYATVFAFAESPVRRGVLWAGSDDGLVHVSQDDGATWQNVTPRGLPEWALISIVEASPHDAATAYVAATRYKLDDFRPYLYRTRDYGRTWTAITDGIPADDFTRVIREDPERRGLLYAGTETGVYVSFDDGGAWHRLNRSLETDSGQRPYTVGRLPVVPIHDLQVKDGDLVAATHGRSIWILDDLSPLRQVPADMDGAAHLFEPRTTVRYRTSVGFGHPTARGKNYRFAGATMVAFTVTEDPATEAKSEVYLDAGRNPPDGAVVRYVLRERPAGDVTLTFLDAQGNEIRSFTSKKEKPDPGAGAAEEAGDSDTSAGTTATAEGAEPIGEMAEAGDPTADDKDKEPKVPKEAGLNRFVWDLRYPPATKVGDDATMDDMEAGLRGPIVAPGTYQVRLTVGDEDHTRSFQVVTDPRISVSQADIEAQVALRLKIRDRLSEVHEAIERIRSLRGQVEGWESRARAQGDEGAEILRAGKTLKQRLAAIEDQLIQTKAKSRQDTLNFPIMLNAKLAGLALVGGSADAAPTRSSYELFEDLSARVQTQLDALAAVVDGEVAAFNTLVARGGIAALAPVSRSAAAKKG